VELELLKLLGDLDFDLELHFKVVLDQWGGGGYFGGGSGRPFSGCCEDGAGGGGSGFSSSNFTYWCIKQLLEVVLLEMGLSGLICFPRPK
jgi:hypothetical protein